MRLARVEPTPNKPPGRDPACMTWDTVMNWQAFAFAVAIGAAAFVPIWLLQTWYERRSVRRLLAEVIEATKTNQPRPRLVPESDYRVVLSDAGIVCTRPDGTREFVSWTDLCRVEIVTTDEGPFLPDVFWVLHGSDGGCVIPQGATGEEELMERLQALPGFRNDVIVDAMSLTDNNRLLCWEREQQVP
jgi:hypothetical protein